MLIRQLLSPDRKAKKGVQSRRPDVQWSQSVAGVQRIPRELSAGFRSILKTPGEVGSNASKGKPQKLDRSTVRVRTSRQKTKAASFHVLLCELPSEGVAQIESGSSHRM